MIRLRKAMRFGAAALIVYLTVQGCRSLLAPPAPPPLVPDPTTWDTTSVQVAYLGHASVLVSLRGTTILTDPAFFDRIGLSLPGITIGPKRLVSPPLLPDELPPIDIVVLSHAHMDSLDRPSLRAVRNAPLLVTPRRTRDLVDDLGFGDVVELHWGESLHVGEIEIEAFEVAHWGRRWPWESWRGYNGYVFRRDDVSLLFASDTAYTRSVGRKAQEDLTAAILGNGAYDPWVWNHATPEQVWQMFRESGAQVLIPIHWDTFALGKEPRGDAMARLLAAAGDASHRIGIRQVGGTWTLPAQR